MAMNRDKFRNIVGGITTAEPKAPAVPPSPAEESAIPVANTTQPEKKPEPAGQGPDLAGNSDRNDEASSGDSRRFAKRGRPKGRKPDGATGSVRKIKVSLFLSEVIVNDLYEWAHDDKMHPGEMFEAALKPFHEREAKRRKGGKG
jgi:hypothetical protein